MDGVLPMVESVAKASKVRLSATETAVPCCGSCWNQRIVMQVRKAKMKPTRPGNSSRPLRILFAYGAIKDSGGPQYRNRLCRPKLRHSSRRYFASCSLRSCKSIAYQHVTSEDAEGTANFLQRRDKYRTVGRDFRPQTGSKRCFRRINGTMTSRV